jgi:hypothetical protein
MHGLPPGDPVENPRSTGVVMEFCQFQFLDVGDLSGQPQHNLACPKGLIGPVDVYRVAQDNADPAIYAALEGLNKARRVHFIVTSANTRIGKR